MRRRCGHCGPRPIQSSSDDLPSTRTQLGHRPFRNILTTDEMGHDTQRLILRTDTTDTYQWISVPRYVINCMGPF